MFVFISYCTAESSQLATRQLFWPIEDEYRKLCYALMQHVAERSQYTTGQYQHTSSVAYQTGASTGTKASSGWRTLRSRAASETRRRVHCVHLAVHATLLQTQFHMQTYIYHQQQYECIIIIITRLMTHVKVIHRVKNRKCGWSGISEGKLGCKVQTLPIVWKLQTGDVWDYV